MSTRTRIILDINGNKYRSGEVRKYLHERLYRHLFASQRPTLNTVKALKEAVGQLKENARLLIVKEPRRVKGDRSLYKTMMGFKEKKKSGRVRATWRNPPRDVAPARPVVWDEEP